MVGYASVADEIHVIVFAKRGLGFTQTQIAPNITVYPTNSRTKLHYIFDAVHLGKGVKGITHVSAQDPFECGLASLFVARFHKAAFQVQMHIDAFGKYFKAESLLNPLRSLIARYVLPRADGIRAVSERIKKSVLNQRMRLHCEPKVLPVYVDVSRFETEEATVSLHEKYPHFDPLILTAGRLVPQKDMPTAFKAFAQFVEKEEKSGLVVVGEGPDEDELKELVATLGLDGRVVFEPWQKDASAYLSYLKTADIFLMTSTHEGYQRALGEAAASGIPVVTTDTGPVGSVYKDGDSVLVCPVGDVACITEKLHMLASDPVLREKLSTRARRVAHDAIAPDYETYIQHFRDLILACGGK